MAKTLRIKLRSYDHRLLDKSVRDIVEVGKKNGAAIAGPVPLPTRREIFTVQRSTFVHKKSREQFEMRTHRRLLDITNPTPRIVDALAKLSLPAGVDVELKS